MNQQPGRSSLVWQMWPVELPSIITSSIIPLLVTRLPSCD
jgi:hypothetical protein